MLVSWRQVGRSTVIRPQMRPRSEAQHEGEHASRQACKHERERGGREGKGRREETKNRQSETSISPNTQHAEPESWRENGSVLNKTNAVFPST